MRLIFRSTSISILFALILAVPVWGIPGFGGPSLPDRPDIIDDVEDVVDEFEDIAYIIENPSLYGLGLGDQGEVITTSLDDAVTDAPFLDNYPSWTSPNGLTFLPSCRMPLDGEGYRTVVPGRFEGTFETFCLHAGTHGPGGGDGYIWAPLKGPWAHIFTSLLKTSEVHPEIDQRTVQYLIWSLQAHTKISDLSDDVHAAALTLLTPEQLSEVSAAALEIIPHDQVDSVFRYFDMPPEVERIMRAEGEIRRLATSGGTYQELEDIAVLHGNPLLSEDSREIPMVRWSYHPDGYFIRYEPHGYSSTDYQVVMPDNMTVDVVDRTSISSIEDEHGNRLDISGNDITFHWRDAGNPRNTKSLHLGTGPVSASWIDSHRSEVSRLTNGSEWVDYIVEIGKIAKLIESNALRTSDESSPERRAYDLACEAWMYGIIAVNMQSEKEVESQKEGHELPKYNWKDSWRPLDPSDGTATPGNRGRQRLGGRSPRPSQDPDWGTAEGLPEYNPDKNPPAHSAREGMDEFNSFTDKLSWLENGITGNAVSAIGFAIPNAVFGGLMEFTLTLWDSAIEATNIDPPRADYDIIASRESFSFTPLVSPDDGPPERIDALNNFLRESMDAVELMVPAVISVDRHGGAVRAGDSYWAFEQAKAAIYFQREAGWETYEAADALDNLIAVLKSEGWDTVYVTADEIRSEQERLRKEGFTPEQLAAADYLQFTDSMKQAWMDYLLSLDPDDAAGSVMDAAENMSDSLRSYAFYLVNLPDAEQEDLPDMELTISP